ncbi:MAG TPA: hypothetical protein VLH56_18745 [Dissulfurispiraceae bacterium]|nr:hypothetical protein [Dissulfurispiraceae bacterium]
MTRIITTRVLSPTRGIVPKVSKPKMPPKLPQLGYFNANRRGPSIGKSAWKPGGTAHKVGVKVDARGVSYVADLVTGKRVSGQRYSVETRAAKNASDLERKFRALVWKATHGGLTANEMDRLRVYGQSDVVQGSIALMRLYKQVFIGA